MIPENLSISDLIAYLRLKARTHKACTWMICQQAADRLDEMQAKKEKIKETACDLCHWPYACNEDDLMKHCEECPIVELLEE